MIDFFIRLYCLVSLVLWTWNLAGCTLPGGNRDIPQIELTIQNTLPIQRNNVPIVLSLAELKRITSDFSFDAYLVVSGQPPREIPSQTDDTNYDGEKDELVFLVDLKPQETKEILIRYSSDNRMAITLGFTKRTRTGIFPELGGFAAIESELVAYLLSRDGSIQAYGKKAELLFTIELMLQGDLDYSNTISPNLRRVFEENSVALSSNTMVEVKKRGDRWLITDLDKKQKYFVSRGEEQLNVYKANELSIDRWIPQINARPKMSIITPLTPSDGLGAGGFTLWHTISKKFIPIDSAKDYVRVLADGPVRSIVQRIIPNSLVPPVGEASLTSMVVIYAGHQWGTHHIKVQGLDNQYRIAIGIPNRGIALAKNEKEGWISTWDEQATTSSLPRVGFGVIYPADQLDAFQDLEAGYMVLISPDETGEVVYRFSSVWGEGEIGIQTREEFEQYVHVTAKDIRTPPVIKFLPQTPEASKN